MGHNYIGHNQNRNVLNISLVDVSDGFFDSAVFLAERGSLFFYYFFFRGMPTARTKGYSESEGSVGKVSVRASLSTLSFTFGMPQKLLKIDPIRCSP